MSEILGDLHSPHGFLTLIRVLPRNILRDSAPVYINCEGDVLLASLQVLLNYRHYSPGAIMSMVEH